ncbi:MAG TPA: hypothetical protein PLJ29_05615 [Leptospiraceae bacterium]|nr:hypothetical protein [Leptospiraceae bacterium]
MEKLPVFRLFLKKAPPGIMTETAKLKQSGQIIFFFKIINRMKNCLRKTDVIFEL